MFKKSVKRKYFVHTFFDQPSTASFPVHMVLAKELLQPIEELILKTEEITDNDAKNSHSNVHGIFTTEQCLTFKRTQVFWKKNIGFIKILYVSPSTTPSKDITKYIEFLHIMYDVPKDTVIQRVTRKIHGGSYVIIEFEWFLGRGGIK